MRILFTSIPGSGHFNPTVPLARALRQRGHDVAYASSPSWTPRVEAAGCENYPSGPAWIESMGDPVMQQIVRKELFVELARMGMVDDVVRAVRNFEADLIVHEGAEIGGLVAGGLLGIPTVMVAPAAAKHWRAMIAGQVARAAAEHGLDGEQLAAFDNELVYVDRTPAAFEMPDQEPYPHLFNARPELYEEAGPIPPWFDDLGSRPIVYVTLGTVFSTNIPLFQLLAGAFQDEPVDVVLATGAALPPGALGDLPENVHVGGYLPQGEVIGRASVVVSHAGYNTVMSALSHGIPMYCVPMGADQPYNAERLVAAGAGLSAPVPDAPPQPGPPAFTPPEPAAIRDAVRTLLEDPQYRAGAARIKGQIEAMPPVSAAAEEIERRMAEVGAIAVGG
ncbi:MAG: glycosyltransferase [Candidatus Dormibacteria bacterium]